MENRLICASHKPFHSSIPRTRNKALPQMSTLSPFSIRVGHPRLYQQGSWSRKSFFSTRIQDTTRRDSLKLLIVLSPKRCRDSAYHSESNSIKIWENRLSRRLDTSRVHRYYAKTMPSRLVCSVTYPPFRMLTQSLTSGNSTSPGCFPVPFVQSSVGVCLWDIYYSDVTLALLTCPPSRVLHLFRARTDGHQDSCVQPEAPHLRWQFHSPNIVTAR